MRFFIKVKLLALLSYGAVETCLPGFAEPVLVEVQLPQQTIISITNPKIIDLKDFFQIHPSPGPVLSIAFSAPEVDGFRDLQVGSSQPAPMFTYKTINAIPYLRIEDAFSENFIWNEYRVDFQLLPQIAPINVANFLSYVSSGRYNHTIIHRALSQPPGSRESRAELLQGGALRFPDPSQAFPQWVPLFPRVPLEAEGSHIAGSLAMARTTNNPDSATSQFFINTTDNSSRYDGDYSVIGHLISDHLPVLQDLSRANLIDLRDRYGPSDFWRFFPLFTQYADDPLSYITFNTFEISEPIGFPESYTWRLLDSEGNPSQQAEQNFSVSIASEGLMQITSAGSGSGHLEIIAMDEFGDSRTMVFPLVGISDKMVSIFGSNLQRNPNLNGIVDVFPGGHYQVDWLGDVYEVDSYLHLSDLGQSQVYRLHPESFMIYTSPVGWLWTAPSSYPWLYSLENEVWIYLYPTLAVNNQRWVFCPEGIEGYIWFPLEWLP